MNGLVIVDRKMDVVSDVIPGFGKFRALCCELFAEDGRSAVGFSTKFNALEAQANAYEMLANKPIVAGHVTGGVA